MILSQYQDFFEPFHKAAWPHCCAEWLRLSENLYVRYFNGISARRVIGYLKENNFAESLIKLRTEVKLREYKHSLWEHHSNTFEIKTEDVLMQKVNYIHWNPVEDGLVDDPLNYRYSSARIWREKPLGDEPLEMDVNKIEWRKR